MSKTATASLARSSSLVGLLHLLPPSVSPNPLLAYIVSVLLSSLRLPHFPPVYSRSIWGRSGSESMLAGTRGPPRSTPTCTGSSCAATHTSQRTTRRSSTPWTYRRHGRSASSQKPEQACTLSGFDGAGGSSQGQDGAVRRFPWAPQHWFSSTLRYKIAQSSPCRFDHQSPWPSTHRNRNIRLLVINKKSRPGRGGRERPRWGGKKINKSP